MASMEERAAVAKLTGYEEPELAIWVNRLHRKKVGSEHGQSLKLGVGHSE